MLRPEIINIIGECTDGEPPTPLGHFYACLSCGQPVDKRDLAAVFHHEEPGHEPLPVTEAFRLLIVDAMLQAAFSERR